MKTVELKADILAFVQEHNATSLREASNRVVDNEALLNKLKKKYRTMYKKHYINWYDAEVERCETCSDDFDEWVDCINIQTSYRYKDVYFWFVHDVLTKVFQIVE